MLTTVEGTMIAYREAVLAGHGIGDADTTGPAIACDDILEVTSEELSELVGLVAREQKLERELRR
jgi:hypothetical protein